MIYLTPKQTAIVVTVALSLIAIAVYLNGHH